ncbi:pyridoxamine 5'-phosphate oxidase family protein [uncultured Megasphaera sp.]|uniref:pyridoxamine 5'-phosphate oxidase family protein n=1 Tax=uncultured Megasphaera sp. TaxID=165188 RepID=UPI002612E929|nr:pyridoxamine 5'-phosphate oxidase family protein [uncultured Megasphaera sp.]
MGNTLCIYDGDAQTRQIACLVGSVLSMSAYVSYTEKWDWERYERIVFVMGPRQAMFSHFAVWQPALQHKKLAFLWNDFQNIYSERIAAAIEARLDRPLDVTAFVSSENWLDDTIRAAQAIQAREKGQGHSDEVVLQAMENFLAGHNTGVLSTGWGQEIHGTPMEYVYEKGTFYFFSEGGRKFIYLYRNRHAAFSVCDAFTDVQHLAGLQAEGRVRFIEPDDEAYPRIAALKGIAPQRLAAMPVVLHVIALDVTRMTFVWSGFLKTRRALRQTYLF